MIQFLSGNLFRYLIFPLGSAALGIWIKIVTRNDHYRAFLNEDIAIGLDLMLTASLLFVVVTSDRSIALAAVEHSISLATTSAQSKALLQAQADVLSQALEISGWIIALMFMGLWGISTFVRKFGWRSETELHPVLGIALPLTIGVLFLIFVMAEAAP